MTNNIEQRAFALEVREALDKPMTLRGYAVVFNQWANIGGRFQERVSPGAFSQTLQENDQVALWNHSDQHPLGRRSAGTLKLLEDKHGLHAEIRLNPKISFHKDVFEAVKDGTIAGMSFRFSVPQGGETLERDERNGLRRTITAATLYEVSPVTFPAYSETEISARASEYLERMADAIPPARDIPKSTYVELPPAPPRMTPEARALFETERIRKRILRLYARSTVDLRF
jgi:HK97 family phage prohead protease